MRQAVREMVRHVCDPHGPHPQPGLHAVLARREPADHPDGGRQQGRAHADAQESPDVERALTSKTPRTRRHPRVGAPRVAASRDHRRDVRGPSARWDPVWCVQRAAPGLTEVRTVESARDSQSHGHETCRQARRVRRPQVLTLAQEALAPPAPGEVRVRQTAIGFNFIDIYQRTGVYPLPLPTGLGFEAAGLVDAVAAGGRGPPGRRAGRLHECRGGCLCGFSQRARRQARRPAGDGHRCGGGHPPVQGHDRPVPPAQGRTRSRRGTCCSSIRPPAASGRS